MDEHFQTLGISSSSTPEEVKAAWKKLCLKTHPDRGGNEADFRKIMHAYSMLTDPEYRHKDKQKTPGDTLTVRMRVAVDFEDAFFGKPVHLTFNRLELGPDRQPIKKEEQELLHLEIHLPAGSVQGYSHFEAGYGNSQGEEKGNLEVQIIAKPHYRYRVENMDVITQERVPLDTMLCGGEIEVQTLFGLRTLEVPPATQPGARLKIKRCGVQEIGLHIVIVEPIFPDEAELKNDASWQKLDIDWTKKKPENEFTINFGGREYVFGTGR